jgi:hypothetical protein
LFLPSIWHRLVLRISIDDQVNITQLIKCYLLVDTNAQCTTILYIAAVMYMTSALKEYTIYQNLSDYLNNLAKYIEDQLYSLVNLILSLTEKGLLIYPKSKVTVPDLVHTGIFEMDRRL